MKSQNLFHKVSVAISSSELLLQSGDFDGASNRAYYVMFALTPPLLCEASSYPCEQQPMHQSLLSAQ